nr:sialidase family protein [Halieaceae bacterium]
MATGRVVPLLAGACVLLASIASGSWAQDGPLAVGPNINMVSGTDWPEGDPFLRQQNEPSMAFSSRNKLHLLAGANDYRTVDVPGDFEAGATGDSWLSYFWSTNGGGTWKSTLIPCYPQDDSPECATSPLNGYAAGADPVVRAGAHGLFYYAGIAFERNDNPRSQIFVSRFIDLNNDEGGDPIRYIDTVQVDVDQTGDRFLDKVWVAVDVPRTGAASKTFSVEQRDGSMVDQTVSCGNIYVAYAALTGEAETLRSEIMLSYSADCGDTWTTPQPISEPDTLNQGANIAIHPITGRVHVGWRRFDTVEAFLGTAAVSCAKPIRDWRRKRKSRVAVDWPIDNVDVGDERLTREQALDLLGQPGLTPSVRLAQFLVAAKLNLVSGGGQATDTFDPAEWTRTLSGLVNDTDDFFRDKPLRVRELGRRTLFIPSGLNFHERQEARNLRVSIRDIYLGSDECVATAGTDPITTGATNAMVATSSTDGASWTPPVTVAEIRTFDQGGTNFSFRTTAYPTLAVDKEGRVYMAYAARGFATLRPDEEEGDARIVLSISSDGGASWQAPYPVDDDPEKPGHQFKPSLLFAGGRLVVVFYDLRADVSGLFERFIYDVPEPDRLRHTLDVRAASASVLAGPMMPEFTLYDVTDRRDSQQASRYAFITTGNGVPVESV